MSAPPPVRSRDQSGLVAALLPLAITLVFVVLTLAQPSIVDDYVENLLVDYRFKLRNLIAPPAVPGEVVVVTIDDRSLAKYGRWPWTRTRVAELIDRVHAAQPRAVAVDLFFSGLESPAADARLAETLARHAGQTAAALVFDVRAGSSFTGEVPDIVLDQAIGRVEKPKLLRPLEARNVYLPPEQLATGQVFGHVNYLPDRNGKLRAEYLYLRYGDEYFPALSLQAARLFLGIPADKTAIDGVFGVDLGGRLLPTDVHGALSINYYGAGHFTHVSAADVLDGTAAAAALRGRLVFIGATAVATYDLIVTPFAANVPGVEKNATVAANILAGDFLRDVPRALEALIVLLVGVAIFFLLRNRAARPAFLALFAFTVLLLAANLAFFVKGWRLNLVYPFGLVVVQGVGIIGQRFLAEERKSGEMRRMFSSYVTERVVAQLIANPAMANLGGHRQLVTILFSDIRGFTSLSEQHRPEDVVAVLNEYLGAMTDVVFRWEGTLDKFIGDAVMVFWGAPLVQEDQAERAIRCAMHMLGRLEALNVQLTARGWPRLEIGIGINTGDVIVGNIGAAGKKMEYTVIGDNVNLASRVESLNKKFGSRLLITENTLARVQPLIERNAFGHVALREVELATVKGRETPVRIYDFSPLEHGSKTSIDQTRSETVVRHLEK